MQNKYGAHFQTRKWNTNGKMIPIDGGLGLCFLFSEVLNHIHIFVQNRFFWVHSDNIKKSVIKAK